MGSIFGTYASVRRAVESLIRDRILATLDATGKLPADQLPDEVARAAYPVQQVTLVGDLAYTLPEDAPSDRVVSVVFTQTTGGHTVTYGGNAVAVEMAAGAEALVEIWPNGEAVVIGALVAAGSVAWADVTDKPAVIGAGATAADARAAISAGTSSFSGAYADLSGKPTLGTAAATAATDYATATQGAKADSALQVATPQTINPQTGTTYTLQASDAGKLVTLTNSAAITLTIPGDVFTAGQRVDGLVAGAGMVTAVGSSCTVNGTPSLVSRAQWSAFSVLFTSATTAVMIGDLAST